MKEYYQIILSYACAGIVTENDIVIRTAPIFNWMMGKNIATIKPWVYKKNGVINKIHIPNENRN